jgi:hypothetical protein
VGLVVNVVNSFVDVEEHVPVGLHQVLQGLEHFASFQVELSTIFVPNLLACGWSMWNYLCLLSLTVFALLADISNLSCTKRVSLPVITCQLMV